MVGPQIEENLSEYEPHWPIGGATATKSTKLLITPRPFDLGFQAQSSTKKVELCH